jgi:L-ascorbate metabolism protein UlaG (beta-lactamase superfamily)
MVTFTCVFYNRIKTGGFMLKIKSINDYEEYFVSENDKATPTGAIRVTSFGTTTLLIDDGESQILIDGFLSRPSLFKDLTSPIATNQALVDRILEREQVNRLKAIFISHSHYDHVLDAAYITRRTQARLYGSPSTLNIGRGGGLPEEQLTLFTVHAPVMVGKFNITVLPSLHSKPLSIHNDLGVAITRPLKQPARMSDYTEGGSFDFFIQHENIRLVIHPSFNFIKNSFDHIQADVLFLGIARLGKAGPATREKFYRETVGKVCPRLVIPIHWDNFFLPLNRPLTAPNRLVDHLFVGLDYLIEKTKADRILFRMLQAFQSIIIKK